MLSVLFTFSEKLMALTINMHKNDCNFYLFYSLVYMWGSYKCWAWCVNEHYYYLTADLKLLACVM